METTAGPFAKSPRHRANSAHYPLSLAFTYIAYREGTVVQRGTGETMEMSSFAVRAKFAELISADVTALKLSIAWPATLEDGTRLQFVVEGRPSWNGSKVMEVLFWKYEFRTAPRRPLTVDANTAASAPFAFAKAS